MPEDLPRMPYGENFRSPDWEKDNQRTRDPNHQATRDRGGGYLLPVSLFPTIGGPMQSAISRMNYTEEQIDRIVEDALNALCLSVQNAVGQTDGGFASIYFSGDEFREHIKDYVKGEIGEVNFLKEQS